MRTSSVIDFERVNLRTRATVDEPLALAPKAAFVAAYPRLVELAGCAPPETFGVVAVDAFGRVAGSTVLGDGERVIVGRHGACDLRLHDGAVALRHVAVLLRFDVAGPSLHVWELATGSPFSTETGLAERAVRSTGPLYLAIHGYALWLVPLGRRAGWPASAEAAFHAMPPRTFVVGSPEPNDTKVRRAPEAPPFACHYRMPAPRPRERSEVTSVAPPLALDDDDGDPREPFGLLVFARGGGGARRTVFTFSAERLERGVLLGRYDRCDLLANLHEDQLSRVHALLVRFGDDLFLLDTASTNGTYRGSDRVTACVLADGDRLALSPEIELVWRRASAG